MKAYLSEDVRTRQEARYVLGRLIYVASHADSLTIIHLPLIGFHRYYSLSSLSLSHNHTFNSIV